MQLQITGMVLGACITALLLGVNVWVTGWGSQQPDSPGARRKQIQRSNVIDGFTAIIFVLILAYVVRLTTHFSYGIGLLLVLVFGATLLLRSRTWVRAAVPTAAIALAGLAVQINGLLGAQLLVLTAQVALLGAGASWPYWLGNRYTGIAGYYFFAVPRVLIILLGAAIADAAYKWDNGAVFRFAAAQGLLKATHGYSPGSGLPDAVFYAYHQVSLGLVTPVAVALVVSTMTMWARYMNNSYKLVVWPLIGWAVGVGLAFVVALPSGPVLAAPYTAIGVVLGALLAVWRTHTWRLVGWAQGWHGDQSHRTWMGPTRSLHC